MRQLYEAAAKTPVDAIDEMARLSGRRDRSGSDAFLCTPVLGQHRRRMRTNVDVEIETRMVSEKCFSNRKNQVATKYLHNVHPISIQYTWGH